MSTQTTLENALIADVAVPQGGPVTTLMVDGNSIAAMAGTCDGEKIRVTAIEHIELESLVEVVRRLRHPVHMDASFSCFTNKELLRDQVRDILSRKEFDNPTLVILRPEALSIFEAEGPATPTSCRDRLNRLVRNNLPHNPYEYPAIVSAQELELGGEKGLTRLLVARLADLLPLVQLIREAGGKYAGTVSALSAAAQVVRRLTPAGSGETIMLTDAGKLRTLYTMLRPDGRISHYPIPVGLARDDMHYFRSIELSADKLHRLKASLGHLLFPPEATPSPLFSSSVSSPQLDCTRFAIQVTRYAHRAEEASLPENASIGEFAGYHYLSGRGSRLPGLRAYMESRLRRKVRRFDRRPIRNITLEEPYKWGQAADNALALGGLIEALQPSPTAFGFLEGELVSPPLRAQSCSISKIAPNKLYVFEQKMDLI